MSIKFIAYPAIALSGILMVGSIAYLWGKPQSYSSLSSAEKSLVSTQPAPEPAVNVAQMPGSSIQQESQITSQPLKSQSTVSQSTVVAVRSPVNGLGSLRVSNRTLHPVRVALLSRGVKSNSTQTAGQDPVHWDFAPEEGSAKGLRLSLPGSNLKLQQGDIVVAFAQDGSRNYWGPYVVGESDQPIWNKKSKEWQLVLED